jgi:hypothetical protein
VRTPHPLAADKGTQEALGQVMLYPSNHPHELTVFSSGSHGAAAVRAHPFFESIDWAALMTKTLPPPFVPQTSSLPLNFDERYMKRTPVDRYVQRVLSLSFCPLNSSQSH